MAYTPKIIDKYLHVTQDGYTGVTRSHSRNWAGVQALVVHVQDGTNWGSWQWFHTVKASSTVLIAKNGDIWRLVPEDRAPWTNGDVANPDAQVRALMNKYGPDPNTWCLTIECEGFSGGLPYTEAQYQSILWQVRDWRNRYGDKPVLAHRQINSVTRPTCPEPPGGPLLPRLYRDLESEAPTDAAFRKGNTVRFTENLNVRRAWNLDAMYKGKPNVVGTLPAGTVATIIAGPNVNAGYQWWDVSIDGFGTGHVAGNWLEKTTPPKPQPVPVRKTFTTRFDLPLRTEPGFNGPILRTLPTGTTGEVVEGPKSKDGIDWMKVTTSKGETGWFPNSILHTLRIAA